jgi:hypothetical protein
MPPSSSTRSFSDGLDEHHLVAAVLVALVLGDQAGGVVAAALGRARCRPRRPAPSVSVTQMSTPLTPSAKYGPTGEAITRR